MLVRFEFFGGPKDGEVLIGRLDGRSFGAAAGYYYASRGGSPGTLLWCRTEYLIELTQLLSDSCLRDLELHGIPLRGHLYVVRHRSSGPKDVIVRARHIGPFPPAGQPAKTVSEDQR